MRNFNSRDGIFKPIPGIKITSEGIPAGRKGTKMYKVEVKEEIAKLHLGPNSRFLRRSRFFANCLHSIMYVNLRKTAPAQKSSNLDPKASFAIPSKEFGSFDF